MARRSIVTLMLTAALAAAASIVVPAQRGGPMTDEAKAERWRVENELASIAVIERKVMIPMRDGIRIAADIYRPKDTSKKYPAIWVRTPLTAAPSTSTSRFSACATATATTSRPCGWRKTRSTR